MTQLDEIRKRNEEERTALSRWPHRYSEDSFYACPLHPEYMGPKPKECECDNEERTQRVADTAFLLSELERKEGVMDRLLGESDPFVMHRMIREALAEEER